MSRRRFHRLAVEQLEDRSVPALLLQFDAANHLIGITGVPNGDVALTFVSNNQVNVRDNAVDLGTFQTGPTVNVALGPTAATDPDLVMNLGGFQFAGKLTLGVGDAPNGWGINVSNGVIAGSLDVTTGSGPDGVMIGEMGPLQVNGPLLINLGAGNDALSLNDTTVQGPLTLNGVNNLTTTNVKIASGLTIDSRFEALATTLSIAQGSAIQGNALIRTGNGKDTVSLGGMIQGNVDLRLKDGNDQFTLNQTGLIGGDLNLLLKRGADKVAISGVIGGDVRGDLGEGNDVVTFDGANVQGFTILLLVSHGNDVFNVGAAGLNAPQANLVFIGCNGNQTVNWVAALPVLLGAYLEGGWGDNRFNAAGAVTFPLILNGFN